MRFKNVSINDKNISNNAIEHILSKSNFNWILKCEFDNADIEIKDNILFWNGGTFYYGEWKWGVVNNGDFRWCDWNGGIFLNGKFNGVWNNGVFKNGQFKGTKIKGEFNG